MKRPPSIVVFTTIFFSILTTFTTYAQSKISFGKVPMELLTMTRYDKDTSAGAVILSDIGRFNSQELEFRRHIRVKILDKKGLQWANWVFNTPSKGSFDVQVFNLVNGEIEKQKADRSSIYEEEVYDDFQVYKVFAPNVKVGSVIDILYTFPGLPFEWRFQERIPVIYSELTLEPSQYIQFSKTQLGFERIEIVNANKWIGRDMPAFQIEPFLNHYSNYITKFRIELLSISIPGYLYKSISDSWRTVVNLILENTKHGGVLRNTGFLNDFAKEVKAKNLGVDERIKEVYAYVQKNIKWNGVSSMFVTETFKKNFTEDHSGNSAEVNLALVYLLNEVGITTYPIGLSTRDNGLLTTFSPSLSQLNYVVGMIQHENVEMFVDATSEHLSPGILPYRCLNGSGLLIKKDNEQWFTLNKKSNDIKRQFIQVKVAADGDVVAKVTEDRLEYSFLEWADEQKEHGNDKTVAQSAIQKANPDIKILSYDVTKKDAAQKKSQQTLEVNMSNNLVDAGDEYIFNPFILFDYISNPFKSETRAYPVDFGCPKELHTTIIVTLPEKMTIKELPKSIKLTNPDATANFTFITNGTGNTIQLKSVLKIQKYVYTQDEYVDLRRFFTELIKVVNSPIHLTKL
jgi:hypothetical protein